MATKVEVAVLGPGAVLEAPFDLPGKAASWEDRPRVTLEVEDDETLGAILERAAQELGMTYREPFRESAQGPAEAIAFIAFKHPEDRTAVRTSLETLLALVQEDGSILWNQPFHSAPFSVIRRTSEAGVLRGDPERIYLVPQFQAGNGVLFGWAFLITAFHILNLVLSHASDLEGTIELVKRLLPRARAAKEALEQEYFQLADRGALPLTLAGTLGMGPWHPDDLAALLSCSSERAVGILQGYGFGQDSAGL